MHVCGGCTAALRLRRCAHVLPLARGSKAVGRLLPVAVPHLHSPAAVLPCHSHFHRGALPVRCGAGGHLAAAASWYTSTAKRASTCCPATFTSAEARYLSDVGREAIERHRAALLAAADALDAILAPAQCPQLVQAIVQARVCSTSRRGCRGLASEGAGGCGGKGRVQAGLLLPQRHAAKLLLWQSLSRRSTSCCPLTRWRSGRQTPRGKRGMSEAASSTSTHAVLVVAARRCCLCAPGTGLASMGHLPRTDRTGFSPLLAAVLLATWMWRRARMPTLPAPAALHCWCASAAAVCTWSSSAAANQDNMVLFVTCQPSACHLLFASHDAC